MDLKFLNSAGRPLNRLIAGAIIALIGLSLVVQFWFWAVFNRPPVPMPAEGIIVAALPYLQTMFDNVVRAWQKTQGAE